MNVMISDSFRGKLVRLSSGDVAAVYSETMYKLVVITKAGGVLRLPKSMVSPAGKPKSPQTCRFCGSAYRSSGWLSAYRERIAGFYCGTWQGRNGIAPDPYFTITPKGRFIYRSEVKNENIG